MYSVTGSQSPPRLLVFVDAATADANTLTELKKVTSRGFAELRAPIASGAPVLDVELFTNEWYDAGAAELLALLAKWESRSVNFTLREVQPGVSCVLLGQERAPTMELSTLRNIVGAGDEDRARSEERGQPLRDDDL